MLLQHTLTPGGCLLKRVKTTNSAALQNLRERDALAICSVPSACLKYVVTHSASECHFTFNLLSHQHILNALLEASQEVLHLASHKPKFFLSQFPS